MISKVFCDTLVRFAKLAAVAFVKNKYNLLIAMPSSGVYRWATATAGLAVTKLGSSVLPTRLMASGSSLAARDNRPRQPVAEPCLTCPAEATTRSLARRIPRTLARDVQEAEEEPRNAYPYDRAAW